MTRCPRCGQLDRRGRRNSRIGSAMVVCSLGGMIGAVVSLIGYSATGAVGWAWATGASFVVFFAGGVFAHFYDEEIDR